MTALVLHGILPKDAPEPSDAPQHLRIELDRMALIVTSAQSDAMSAEQEPGIDEVLAHHQLLSAYALQTDVLPVRFGTVFSSASGMLDGIATDEEWFCRGMARLRGRVEFALSLVWGGGAPAHAPYEPSPPSEDGRTFLTRKRAVRDGIRNLSARRDAFARGFAERIATVTNELRQSPTGQKDTIAFFAVLVDRDDIAPFVSTVRDLAEDAGALGLTVKLRGPGPCYSFADIRETEERGRVSHG
ncbi:hypothetical protein GQ651_08765 [Alphaproteobacteria bacterium GH1-50]|uniref:Gas vesicle protein GvpL/GvpF n=1 Tax=Kangsaoukella pontilimi TaxID=2691042 RepID=A0A7C9MFV9_9RHOB|nr:GvpL/GvpF family gas vesicle protein [Kangsaoukella pontilimi]MXQ07936.1 hypothetical protein [Kangsaoukella pontilimi]